MSVLMNYSPPGIRRIGAAFSAKTHSYATHAVVQEAVLARLADLVIAHGGPWGPCVDAGAGIGGWQRVLAERGVGVSTVCIDISGAALRYARTHQPDNALYAEGDVCNLPLRQGRCGMIVCASVLQWVTDSSAVLRQFNDALRPGGMFAFGVFMDGTLCELDSLRQESKIAPPVCFFGERQWNAMLIDAGLEPVASVVYAQTTIHTSAWDALRSLSRLGAGATAVPGMSRGRLRSFCTEYERRFRTPEGVPLKYVMRAGLARKAGDHA